MKLFCMDLDNTIIYSYKHDIGPHKRNVELYQGREISFITDRTYELLMKMRTQYLAVPVSTRTIEQYQRIQLGIGEFPYALVCNGGILLRDGERDENWYADSRESISPSLPALKIAMEFLEKDMRRTFELRFIEELFVFTKCDDPEQVTKELREMLVGEPVDVFHNGTKVYVVPQALSKGNAVKRLCALLQPEKILAAGDSEFDISMVEAADAGFVPQGFLGSFSESLPIGGNVTEMSGEKLFSEEVLENVMKM